ncbi:MAG: N-acylglucosamine 2-epimerase, partial [Mycobacteriales bacterium]
TDNATPSGLAAAAGALLTYAALTGSDAHRTAAEAALRTVAPLFGRHARFAGWACAVAEALVAGPAEVAVVERPDLLAVARLATSPGAVVVGSGPLVEGRPAGAAYVCRSFVCEAPTTDAARLREQLGVRQAR